MNDRLSKVLKRLERRSKLEKTHKLDIPPDRRMLAITRDTGELIRVLLLAGNAKNVLEIGTSVGYSTLWCADALARNSGTITTIESNPEKIARAEKNFRDAGVLDIIKIINGTALDVLEQLGREKSSRNFFDFVLIDADKENVIKYFDLVVPMVRKGGIIMTDNMTYPEKYHTHMKRFARYIRKNPEIISITCTIGNGEEISVRI